VDGVVHLVLGMVLKDGGVGVNIQQRPVNPSVLLFGLNSDGLIVGEFFLLVIRSPVCELADFKHDLVSVADMLPKHGLPEVV
jgi:hypothetical protein